MTIEFETEIENGKIAVPEQFRRQLKNKIKVTVSIKESAKSDEEPYDIISELMENPINDPNFIPLTRDEIYDRKL